MSSASYNSTQDHSMFMATGSNPGFEETAGMIGGKTVHKALLRELLETEDVQVKLPDRKVSKEVVNSGSGSSSGSKGVGKGRKKVIQWTTVEHCKFLIGLKEYGKGAWDKISKMHVVTKTAKQVTSHAQKYHLWQAKKKEGVDNNNKKKKRRKRRSIHDITIEEAKAVVKAQLTPTPGIQDIATTDSTMVVQVEPPPPSSSLYDIGKGKGKGKGVLIEPSSTGNYLYDGQYYTSQSVGAQQPLVTPPVNYFSGGQGEGAYQTPPMNYYSGGQGEGAQQTPPMNYYSGGLGEGAQQTMPMNYFSGGLWEAPQPSFNFYGNQGVGELQSAFPFFDYNEGIPQWYEYGYDNSGYSSDYY